MSSSLNSSPMKTALNQYQESENQLLNYFKDCVKFGYGDLHVSVEVTSRDKREIHIKYGKDHKYLVSLNEMNECKSGSRRGSAN